MAGARYNAEKVGDSEELAGDGTVGAAAEAVDWELGLAIDGDRDIVIDDSGDVDFGERRTSRKREKYTRVAW